MNIMSVIERVGRRRTTHPALRSEDVELSYDQLLDRAARIGGYLVREGLKPGERVAVFLHNQPEYLPMILGIWKAGGVFVPLNALFAPSAIRHAIEDSEARWVLTRPDAVSTMRDALDGLEAADHIISTGTAEGASTTTRAMLETDPLTATVPRKDDDDAVLMYTSGSTAAPKGVRQTHRNSVAASEATIDAWELTDDSHSLVCTPLFHVGGLQLISLPTLLAGGTVTLMKWSVHEFLELAVSREPTVLAIVPAMMIDIVNTHDDGPHLGSVKVCAIGGSALPSARLEAFTKATGVVPVNIYGQTEQAGLVICEPLHEARREGTLGRPLSSIVEHRIVALGSNDPNETATEGELWVRGDAVTPGYWRLPKVNEQKFVNGWFRTSDIVRTDDDGFLYYIERTDDMIISGGENLYPQMIEGFLQGSDLVAEVAVIGTKHERLSQQVTAIIVPSRPDVTADDIAAYCQSRPELRGLQRPRRIEVVEAIPRTATNKIDRPVLRRQYR